MMSFVKQNKHAFQKKKRQEMWETMLPSIKTDDLFHGHFLAFCRLTGSISGQEAELTLTEMNNGARKPAGNVCVMLQAQLSFGTGSDDEKSYISMTAFNTAPANNQPKGGPFFRLDNIEIKLANTKKRKFKAPLPFGQRFCQLFNNCGLRPTITPLQYLHTATALSHVLDCFKAKRPVQMENIALIFHPENIKKPPAQLLVHAGSLARIRKSQPKH